MEWAFLGQQWIRLKPTIETQTSGTLFLTPMGRKHKKHLKQSAQAKEKDTSKDHELSKTRLRIAFSHALSSGWVQNTTIAFLVSFVGLVVTMITKIQVKIAAITFGLMGTAALWILVVVVIRYAAMEEIVITRKLLFLGTTGKLETSGPFWIKYKGLLGDTLSPLPVSMYVVIHNTQPTPVKITSLRVSMQAKDNDWLQLTHVDGRSGQVFWVGDNPKHATQIEDQTTMLDFILSNAIAAYSPVEGWLHFSTSREYPHSPGTWLRLKFTLKDTSGKTMEYSTAFEKIESHVSFNRSDGFDENVLIRINSVADLTQCCISQFWPGGIVIVPKNPIRTLLFV